MPLPEVPEMSRGDEGLHRYRMQDFGLRRWYKYRNVNQRNVSTNLVKYPSDVLCAVGPCSTTQYMRSRLYLLNHFILWICLHITEEIIQN